MQYTISGNDDEALVSLDGKLTFDEHEVARGLLREMVSSPAARIVYEMSAVPAIDSSGIGLLLMTHDRLSKAGKTFMIRGAKGEAARAITLAKVDALISVEA